MLPRRGGNTLPVNPHIALQRRCLHRQARRKSCVRELVRRLTHGTPHHGTAPSEGTCDGCVRFADTRPRDTKQADTLTVVGATQPSQIPEWLVWEYSFTLLKQWQGKDSGFTHDLRETLSSGEFEILEKEALAHTAREARREARAATLMEKYPHASTTDAARVA